MRNGWLGVMRDGFLPYLASQGFSRVAFSRVLHEQGEGHFTFSLLVEIDSLDDYRRFTGPVWEEYVALAAGAFGEQVLWFITLMKEVDDDELR